MKSRGFTLIELLAVIVILAIIALIAVPIVIKIIDDFKTSSEEQSVELYIDSVSKAIARKQLEDNNFNPESCMILPNGNLECNEEEIIIDMKGIKPSKGIIEIEDNKVGYKNLLLNGTYYNKIAELVLDNNNNGEPDVGDKYTYKVNDSDIFNFYVLSFNEDNTVNLIMDRNICEDGTVNYANDNNYCRCAWHAGALDNNYGPDTAITKLYNATKDWSNVPYMIMKYEDENNTSNTTVGYTSIITDPSTKVTTITGKQNKTSEYQTFGNSLEPLKSRLPMESEVTGAGCTATEDSCPEWLVDNLKYDSSHPYSNNIGNKGGTAIYNIQGYLLLSSYGGRADLVRRVSHSGNVNVHRTSYDNINGVRPVITVPVEYLEN